MFRIIKAGIAGIALVVSGCATVGTPATGDQCGFEWRPEPRLYVAQELRKVTVTRDVEMYCGKGAIACAKSCATCSPAWADVYLPRRVDEKSEAAHYCETKNMPAFCCGREELARHENKHLDGWQHQGLPDPMMLAFKRR